MRSHEVSTSPFVWTHKIHVTGSKRVHTKRILIHYFVLEETVCESSAHGPTITSGVVFSLVHDRRIQTRWISNNILRCPRNINKWVKNKATPALAGFHAGPPSWSNWNLKPSTWFLWSEENRRIRRKTLGTRREPTANSTHIKYRAGIKPRPHWWEASALTAALTLLPFLHQQNF